MKILAVLFWLAFLLGTCAGCETLSEYEIADRWVLRADVWSLCVASYEYMGRPMIHTNHSHSITRAPSGLGRHRLNLRDDIRDNNCDAIFRAYTRSRL